MTDNEKDKLDLLIERNTEQQLAKFDWEKLHTSISSRFNSSGRLIILRSFILKVAAAAALTALILTASQFLFVKQPVQTPDKISSSIVTTAGSPGNNLIARTDPETILLTGQHHIVSNDEMLKPHSVWAQKPVCCAN
jgi:hypothetical protein